MQASVDLLKKENVIHLYHTGDEIGILSFLSKANCANPHVLAGIQEAITIAEKQLKGLILWQPTEKFFCVGADLSFVQTLAKNNDTDGMNRYLSLFQDTALALRYSKIPVISAIRGYALGGGCELAMHCTKIVAAQTSRIGLVEAGIGLLPSGGGSKEMVLRATQSGDYETSLKKFFLQVARGEMSRDAAHAKMLHYLRDTDTVVTDSETVLTQAKRELLKINYSVPPPPKIRVLGKSGLPDLMQAYKKSTDNITQYDEVIAREIAQVFVGGDHSDFVSERDMLDLELAAFIALATNPKTQERIQYTLKTGQHLHN